MSEDDLIRTLERLDLALARLGGRGGDGGSQPSRRGGRTEFAGHRPYAPGDDVRTVDWAAHARTGKLVVREFERDEDADVLLIVDASASMGLSGKLALALRLTYALAWVALRTGGRVRVGVASAGGLALGEEVAGAGGAPAVRSALSRIDARGGTDLARSLARVPAAGLATRLVILLSDLLGAADARAALATLAGRAGDLVLLHVRAAEDLAAADDDEDVVLEDAESGERLVAAPGAAERARRSAAADEESWRAFAAHHRLRYAELDAAAPLGVQTVRALRAAGVLA